MANLKKCSICGAEYTYCPNCANTHAWKFYTDTREHYQIFMILQEYNTYKDKESACVKLENIGITTKTDLSVYKPKIAEKLKDIMTIESKKSDNEKEKAIIKKDKKNKSSEND